jgi:phosphopantothenoylcysteine decarboxylase/phosphopantothenate--cysteine ligase
VSLILNPDILVELVQRRPHGQVVVGFAAETGDADGGVLAHGRAKLGRKGCDLLVVNAVGHGRGFEVERNAGWLLGDDGAEIELPEGPKSLLASHVWDAVVARLKR